MSSSHLPHDFDTEAGYLNVDNEDTKKVRSMNSCAIFVSCIVLVTLVYGLSIVLVGSNKVLSLPFIDLTYGMTKSSTHRVDNSENTLVTPTPSLAPKIIPEPTISSISIQEEINIKNEHVISQSELQNDVDESIDQIRGMKNQGVVIETDSVAQGLVTDLQNMLRKLIPMKYGLGPYFVEMKLVFPTTMPDYDSEGEEGILIIQLGPIELVPYSIYYFMELVSNWKGGAFHRVAGHVLQAQSNNRIPGLAFQEYHPDFPHKVLTMGYAGDVKYCVRLK